MTSRFPGLVSLAVALLVLWAGCSSCGDVYVAEVASVSGQVERDQVERRGVFVTALIGDRFGLGDGLRTGKDGYARLSLEPDGLAVVEPNTLLRFLAEHHDTLRARTEDSNRSRWPLHPLWVDLQQRIAELHRLETKQVDGKDLVLDERLTRLTISIYGYPKRMAAVSCVKQGLATMAEEEALGLLGQRLRELFDPLSWKVDVQKRMKAIGSVNIPQEAFMAVLDQGE